jgi:CRP/FNR family transcriptional regulator, cyclic AMP receptor protein
LRSRDKKVDRLGEVYLFRRCSRHELQLLAGIADELTVEAGRVLCEAGTVARECFVVAEGEAEVRVDGHVVATIGPGESIGEIALLTREPRSATVVTTAPCDLYVIDGNRFDALLEDIPRLARSLLEELSDRLRNLDAAYGAVER